MELVMVSCWCLVVSWILFICFFLLLMCEVLLFVVAISCDLFLGRGE